MTKKLTRSLNQRKIAGVCGGLGEYFKLDPVIFRFLFPQQHRPNGGQNLGDDYTETIDV